YPGAAASPEGRSHRMTAQEFVRQRDGMTQRDLGLLAPADALKPEVEGDLNVLNLLKVALRNEIEATEIAARWLVTTDDVDVKLALARQVGDEAKHYRMIAERLRALGFAATSFDPLAKGYGPLFQYLDTLKTTVERVAAGQFTREAIAVVKNRQFIEFCDHAGDRETAAMYRDVIEPDERYHHELGRTLLLRLATTAEAQAAATRAARRTLELADERLCGFLFDGAGFRGNADDYYDPRNSCLNDVLDRRLGIPITLSVLVMEVGRRVGLEIQGIGLPGHFCVGARVGDELLVLDPFGGGRRLGRDEAEAIVSRVVGRPVELTDTHFVPATKAQIVVRMLRNLQGIYARREDWAKALAVIDRLLVVEADAPLHDRERRTALVKLGDLHRGASEWERYLPRYPTARDAAACKERLRRVRQTLAEKN